MHIHILGAPGAGVTTLGKALAERLEIKAFDTDDYYWFTEDVLPYRRKRNPDHRRKLITADLAANPDSVLSGSLCGWGDVFMPQFDFVIYLWLPVETRLARIKARETARYGEIRIGPGGDLYTVFEKFMIWAANYDEPSGNVRSREKEMEWLSALHCPVLEIVEEMDLEAMIEHVLFSLDIHPQL